MMTSDEDEVVMNPNDARIHKSRNSNNINEEEKKEILGDMSQTSSEEGEKETDGTCKRSRDPPGEKDSAAAKISHNDIESESEYDRDQVNANREDDDEENEQNTSIILRKGHFYLLMLSLGILIFLVILFASLWISSEDAKDNKNGVQLTPVNNNNNLEGSTTPSMFPTQMISFLPSASPSLSPSSSSFPSSLPSLSPTTALPTTLAPTTLVPTTLEPTTLAPTTSSPTLYQSFDLLNFNVVDAEYSKSLNRIVILSTNPNQIHLYDPTSGNDKVQSLPLPPECVSVNNGTHAAVGYNGWVSYINLSKVGTGDDEDAAVEMFAVSTDVFDIVLANDDVGYIYVFPRSDQWVRLHAINIATGMETQSRYIIRERTKARLHPSGNKMYGATNGLSPSDIERYDISSAGFGNTHYDSPYHGDHPFGGDLWFSEDGGRIFAKSRCAFRSSDIRDMDMVYAGSIGSDDCQSRSGAVYHLDHSSLAEKIAMIPGASSTILHGTNHVEIYNDAYLNQLTTILLPDYYEINKNKNYKTYGKYVFFDSTGENFYVIGQVDASSSMIHDNAIISYQTDIATN